jgi:hypothetical protein
MSYRSWVAVRAQSHYGAYRAARVALLVMVTLFALLFVAYAGLSIVSVFLWSLR